MRARLLMLSLICLALAACAGPQPVVHPTEQGSSRADGIVAMTATATLYQPVPPDWAMADAAADARCQDWGHAGQKLAGWRETCRMWDRWGRCLTTRVTRYYDCRG